MLKKVRRRIKVNGFLNPGLYFNSAPPNFLIRPGFSFKATLFPIQTPEELLSGDVIFFAEPAFAHNKATGVSTFKGLRYTEVHILEDRSKSYKVRVRSCTGNVTSARWVGRVCRLTKNDLFKKFRQRGTIYRRRWHSESFRSTVAGKTHTPSNGEQQGQVRCRPIEGPAAPIPAVTRGAVVQASGTCHMNTGKIAKPIDWFNTTLRKRGGKYRRVSSTVNRVFLTDPKVHGGALETCPVPSKGLVRVSDCVRPSRTSLVAPLQDTGRGDLEPERLIQNLSAPESSRKLVDRGFARSSGPEGTVYQSQIGICGTCVKRGR